MAVLTRKEFLTASALLAAGLALDPLGGTRKKEPLLAFSTLGCPDWTFSQVTDFAARHGYRGIELRGLMRQMDLPLCPEFNTEEARKATTAQMKAKGLSFVNLGSSATLHFPEGTERQKHLSDAKRFIDLASQIQCPYIRVFPNNFPKGQEKKQTMDLISQGLKELGEYAALKKVTVLMETHGEVVWIDDLLAIMQAADHKHVGLVWDPSNMWTVTKEPPSLAWNQLKNYIYHTHIKDAMLTGGKLEYRLLGEGDVPVLEAVNALRKDGYKGYYSFEWEKLWHPEIAAPEIALADYPKKMKGYFKKN